MTLYAAADDQGRFSNDQFIVQPHDLGVTFTLTATGTVSGATAQTTFTDSQHSGGQPAANLDQCRNGAPETPNNCLDFGGSAGWVNGNAGETNAHYTEGLSIPYRAELTNLPTDGTVITLTLGYDIKHSGRHAIDFLTHYQRLLPHTGFAHTAETVVPYDGVTGLTDVAPADGIPDFISTFAIPVPEVLLPSPSPVPGQPATRFNSLPAVEREMTLFGGTITGIAYVTPQGDLTASNSETQIQVTFTADTQTAVLAWGGHIARAADWGTGKSAGAISGSPFHMRLLDWNLNNLGNQDRSLKTDAVFSTGTIEIIKEAEGGDEAFDFSTSGGGGLADSFSLTIEAGEPASVTFTDVLAGTYTVTEELLPSGWNFENLFCVETTITGEPADNQTTVDLDSRTATIDLDGNEIVTCTYVNRAEESVLSIIKTNDSPAPEGTGGFVDLDNSGDVSVGDTITYTYTVTNTGTADFTNITLSDDKLTGVSVLTLTSGLTDIDGDTVADDLAAGASATGTATYVIATGDLGTTISNIAETNSDQDGPASDTSDVVVPSSVLSIVKTNDSPAPEGTGGFVDADGSGDLSVGDTVTYTYTVTNTGTADFTNITLSDDKLAGVSVLTLTSGLTDIDEDSVLDDLAAGASATGTATYVIATGDLGTTITNTADTNSDQDGPASDTSDVVVPSSVLSIIKTNDSPAPEGTGGFIDADGSGDVSVGDTITYTYTVTNTGTADFTNITLSDDQLAGVSVSTLTSGLTDIDGDTVADDLAAGATATGTATYVIVPGDLGTTITNIAETDSDQDGPADDTSDVVVPSSVLSIIKTNDSPAPEGTGGFIDADGSGDVSVGDTITYTFAVENTGGSNLTGVTVVDSPLGPVTLVDSVLANGIGFLVPGETEIGTLTYVVDVDDVTAGTIDNTATADSDQTGPDTDSNTIPVPSPSLNIVKTNALTTDLDGSGDVSVGDTITYTFAVENTGGSNLTGVTVVDSPLGPVTLVDSVLANGIGFLVPGETEIGTLTYVVDVDDVTAGTIDNTATADSDQTGPDTDSNTIPVPSPSLNIVKTNALTTDLDGSGDVSVGDTITYTFAVENTGGSNLTGVTVVDSPLGPVTLVDSVLANGIGFLVPGETEIGTLTYVVDVDDVTAGTIDNTATAGSDQTGPDTDSNTIPVPSPSLSIVKTNALTTDLDGSGDVSVGDTITYTFAVENTGGSNLTGVTVVDSPLGPVTLVDSVLANGIGFLVPGETEIGTLTYVVDVDDVTAGTIDNTATADSDQTGPDTDSNTIPVPSPSLNIVKTNALTTDLDGSGDVSVGDTITYTFAVENTGGSNLTGVTVVDSPLGPVTLVDSVLANGIGFLVPGETEIGTLTYVVDVDDVTAGTIDNTATADSDQTGPDTDSNTIPVPSPSLNIVKTNALTTDLDGSGDVSVGDTITYTFAVENTGGSNLTGVTVVDSPLGPVTLVDSVLDNGIGFLVPGETEIGTLTYVVDVDDVTAGTIDNTATADSDQTGPDTDSNTIPVPSPSLNIVKTNALTTDLDGSGDVSVGDTITYTFAVENTGGSNLTGVTVVDSPLGPVTLVDSVLANGIGFLVPGETEIGTLTYVVDVDDVTAGTIDNTATAGSDQTGPDTDSNTIPVPSPSLSIVKTNDAASGFIDADGSGDLSVGDTVTYTYTVTNTGTATLTGVAVNDDLLGATLVTGNGADVLAPGGHAGPRVGGGRGSRTSPRRPARGDGDRHEHDHAAEPGDFAASGFRCGEIVGDRPTPIR